MLQEMNTSISEVCQIARNTSSR